MGIASELIERGWCKDLIEDDRGRVCLVGAMNRAYFESWARALSVVEALAVERGFETSNNHPFAFIRFNNAPETTYDDVLRLAKEADEILDAS